MTSTKNTVCRCGEKKYYKSKLCLDCYMRKSKQSRSHHPKDQCPTCPGQKMVTSKVCRSCWANRRLPVVRYEQPTKANLKSPDWERVPREFMLSFTGIFLAEGSVRAIVSRDTTLSLSLVIQLRIDDLPALQAVEEQLGGAVRTESREGHSPMVRWEITKREDVRDIVASMRQLTLIPMRKAQEFDVVLSYFEWRDQVGFDYIDRARIEQFHNQIAASKKYSE